MSWQETQHLEITNNLPTTTQCALRRVLPIMRGTKIIFLLMLGEFSRKWDRINQLTLSSPEYCILTQNLQVKEKRKG